MKHFANQPKKMCKNRAVPHPPLYTSFNRRKTLGKSGVSSSGQWEVYGKQRLSVAEKSDALGDEQ